jgi:NADPH:quinone reductase-like Zn-dependent oxidoreductase
MKAINLTGPSLDHLQLVDTAAPRPGHGEVLIRQRAVSLNYLDLAIARGEFGPGRFPIVPGADSAGDIVALGEGVDGWAIGDRVVVGTMLRWQAGALCEGAHAFLRGVNVDGGLAEFSAVPAAALVRAPSHLDWREAATLPIAATTAWNAIVKAKVRPGTVVLLLGTGGVSVIALQLAKIAGARVIVTSSSHDKLARLRALGADELIHYGDTPAWDEEVLRLTDGHGADLVIESVGAATFARSLNAAAYGGMVFVIGFVGGTRLDIPVLPIMLKTLTIQGNNTGSTADLRSAAHAIAAARIHPVIDRIFPLAQIQEAYRYLAGAGHVGKVVIDLEAARIAR